MKKRKKIIFILISIVLIVLEISLLSKKIINNSMTAPEVTAPNTKENFSDETFNNCFKESKTVNEVSVCYLNRIETIKNKENKNILDSKLYILIPKTKNNINKYIVYNTEYIKGLDTSFVEDRYVSFEYPSNKIIDYGIYDEDLYNKKEAKNKYKKDIQQYKDEKIFYSKDNNYYVFPLSDKNSEYFLNILTFKKDKSEQFIEEINNYLN